MRGSVVKHRFKMGMIAGATLLVALAAGAPVHGQVLPWRRSDPVNCPPTPCQPAIPTYSAPTTAAPLTDQSPRPEADQQAAAEPSLTPERFGAVGGESVALATPNMIGDLIGPMRRVFIQGPNGVTRSALVPFLARGAFKIAENESPRPTDRVFFNYNYFSGVGEASGIPNTDVHRETIGFEKTFLDKDASIGIRLPFFQTRGDGSISSGDVGDLSVILKFALYNNRDTGNVFSTGLVVTAPTGNESLFNFNGDNIHDTLLQPFVGFIYNMGDFYFHGFSSLVVPTDSQDVTVLFNDIGVGYWMYRNSSDNFLTAIAPTIEGHVTTPLNHRNSTTDPIVIPDWFTLTGGVTMTFNHRSTLLLGVGTPLTGPKPFDVEAVVQLNFSF